MSKSRRWEDLVVKRFLHGDALTLSVNRLPLPLLSLLDYVTQAWEGEVKGKHQRPLGYGLVEKPPPGGHSLLGNKVDCRIPVRLLQMDGMEHGIGDDQELLAP